MFHAWQQTRHIQTPFTDSASPGPRQSRHVVTFVTFRGIGITKKAAVADRPFLRITSIEGLT
jgi:hypothetical protein